MHDGAAKNCDTGKDLFDSLSDDLLNLVPGITYSPDLIRAPDEVVFSPIGPFCQERRLNFPLMTSY